MASPLRIADILSPSVAKHRSDNYTNIWKPTSNCDIVVNYETGKCTIFLKQFPKIGYTFNFGAPGGDLNKKHKLQNHTISVLEAIFSLLNKEKFFFIKRLTDAETLICAQSIFIEDVWIIINPNIEPIVSGQYYTEACKKLFTSYVMGTEYLYIDSGNKPDASKVMWERYIETLPQKYLDDYVTSIVEDVTIK
jgi:hypothetical protein